MADQVQVEDVGVCEEVQRDLNSRSYTTGRFSVKRENGGYHFHQMLGTALTGRVSVADTRSRRLGPAQIGPLSLGRRPAMNRRLRCPTSGGAGSGPG